MDCLATFHTHFDAVKYQKFIKTIAVKAVMKPVPRKLSSSCGSCVLFTIEDELPLSSLHSEDFEALYRVKGEEYELLVKNE